MSNYEVILQRCDILFKKIYDKDGFMNTSKKILIVDAERLINGQQVFTSALQKSFHMAGYDPLHVESTLEALDALNLYLDRHPDDSHKGVLRVRDGKEFNPERYELVVARMGHTLSRSTDRALNERADPYHLTIQHKWDYMGGHSLVRLFEEAMDRNGNCFERPTLQSRSLPYVLGVSAGQLEEDARRVDISACLHDVVFHTLPDYNPAQPIPQRLHSATVKTVAEGVNRVVESTKQIIGAPKIGLC